jgi:CRP/FNR family transcriptional regulator, cyclic AMP receptor protein
VTRWAPGTLLSALGDAERQELTGLGGRRVFAPGEALINEGYEDKGIYILLKGFCKVLCSSADGRSILLSVRVGGDLVGELAAFDDKPRSASVIACTAVVTRTISQRALLEFMEQRPAAATAIRIAVMEGFRRATRFRTFVSGAPTVVRLAFILDYLAQLYGRPCPEGTRIEVPLSQQELASLLGASEPSLHRALARLRQDESIITRYRQIVVRDLQALRLTQN